MFTLYILPEHPPMYNVCSSNIDRGFPVYLSGKIFKLVAYIIAISIVVKATQFDISNQFYDFSLSYFIRNDA